MHLYKSCDGGQHGRHDDERMVSKYNTKEEGRVHAHQHPAPGFPRPEKKGGPGRNWLAGSKQARQQLAGSLGRSATPALAVAGAESIDPPSGSLLGFSGNMVAF